MSDKLYPFSLKQLLTWILEEEKSGQIFGMVRELFWKPRPGDPFRMERFGQILETPVGVAAGPHTEMAQNIVSAWLMGARFIELKTVQTLDELNVPKPCIDMEDEGYNVEWSQELRLDQSFSEYLNAWILLHVLRHKFRWNDSPGPGFIFNMSVGYNLEGIFKPNVQRFLSKMQNCAEEKHTRLEEIRTLYPAIDEVKIPDTLSDNVTLSTMHGCPPEEIEQIASYFMEEKKLHTTVKLNPTLLGPQELREILNKKLGFPAVVPDEAFEHDLKYDDALQMIQNLRNVAEKSGVSFGLKLSNTLETQNNRPVFAASGKMAYLSGRALHPLTIRLAAKLQEAFQGELDISFSGGADAFNVADLVSSGLAPITVCTDLLKPGGYTRLPQYLDELRSAMQRENANSISGFILKKSGGKSLSIQSAALKKLQNYAEKVSENHLYKKEFYPNKSIKTTRSLEPFDCISAPCVETCPAHQDVPEYMFFTAKGDADRALEVILETNPFPLVTGMACDHLCQTKCTRQNYDESLQIREIKRFAAERGKARSATEPAAANGLKGAVIGAGPSGLSCAYFLARAGCEVEIFEAKSRPGGMAAAAIPSFRLPVEAIEIDVNRIEKLGVGIHYNTRMNRALLERLRREKNFLYLSVGAQAGKKLGIPGENLGGVSDALDFLSRIRRGESVSLGERVAVIGGGNTAMDAARTARRLVGKKGQVFILYRRTRNEMPADADEIREALREGVEFIELVSPVEIRQKAKSLELICRKMKLGKKDASGRRRPIPVEGSEFALELDSIIPAVGQELVLDFLNPKDLEADIKTHETKIPGLYIGGDALRGPSSLILAIADGKEAARHMLKAAGKFWLHREEKPQKYHSLVEFQKKAARRQWAILPEELPAENRFNFKVVTKSYSEEDAHKEADRCLYCDEICNVCVGVCPNRANLSYTVQPVKMQLQKIVLKNEEATIEPDGIFEVKQAYQVLNVADWCNECGNCTTFCPTRGAPYKDKPKLCLSEESFRDEPLAYRLGEKNGHPIIWFKEENGPKSLEWQGAAYVYETEEARVELDGSDFSVRRVQPKTKKTAEIELQAAASLRLLLDNLKDSYLAKVALNFQPKGEV